MRGGFSGGVCAYDGCCGCCCAWGVGGGPVRFSGLVVEGPSPAFGYGTASLSLGEGCLVVEDGLSPVERWRRDVFVRAGFNDESAELLALSDAETGMVVTALEAGCSRELAVELFV